jgi:gluconolactonase
VLSPDQALLAVDAGDGWVWSFQLGAEGALLHGQRFYRLEAAGEPAPGAAGMTADSEGFLYAATRTGLQVFDQPGRVTAIIDLPGPSPASGIVFGGSEMNTLYVTAGDTLFRRRLRRKGVFPGPPVKLPTPRL